MIDKIHQWFAEQNFDPRFTINLEQLKSDQPGHIYVRLTLENLNLQSDYQYLETFNSVPQSLQLHVLRFYKHWQNQEEYRQHIKNELERDFKL